MAPPAERPETNRVLPIFFSEPAFLPVPLFLLLFAAFYLAGPEFRSWRYVYDPPWLLFALNSVFITGLCLFVAWMSLRSYLRGGFPNVLLLGCGVLAFGLSSLAAGWLIRPPYGLNDTLTIHNSGVLFTSACLFLSSLSAFRGVGTETELAQRKLLAGSSYVGILLLVSFLTAATILDWTPRFFIPGDGPTVLRQVVLAVTVTLLAVSALLTLSVYSERKTGFLLYSVIAILLIGSGLVTVAIGTPGSPLSWLGRASQYLGDVYLVIAAMKALSEAKSRGTTVEEAMADYFRKSETHYRALVEMAADAIVACDHEGRILLMNPAAEQIFGYRRDEAVGKSMAGLFVPERSQDLFRIFLAGEACRDTEMEMARKDGTVFSVEISVSPEMESRTGTARTLIVRDITGRKQAEESLRESELRFRTLAEATFEGVAVTEEGRFTDMNDQFSAFSGYDRTELIGMDVADLVHPDDRERVLGNILAGRESSIEHRLVRKDGSHILVEAHGKTIRQEGRTRRYTSIRDISEARRAEESLREAKELLERRVRERTAELLAAAHHARSLLEASLDPLVTINREGQITDVNRATEQVTGVSRDHLIGTDFADYFTDPAAARAGYRKAFTESQVRDYPLTIRHAGGRTTDVMYHASVYRNSAGEVLGIFAAARDVTEIRKAEAALREINESLERRVSERTAALQLAKDYAETLIRTANVLIIGLDAAGNITTFNDQAEQVTGYTRAEIMGRNWFEVAVPKDRFPHVWEAFGRLQQGALPEEFENPILTRDGRERIISWRNSAILEAGRVKGTISFGRDITDRRKAEESLRAQHEQLKIAQLAANAGIWGWEVPTGKLTWSEEFYALFGLDPATPATFETWLGTLHPNDRQPASERIERSIRDGTALENEFRVIRPDGKVRWIRARGSTVYDGIGRPLSMSGICIDVTEGKRAEEALRESELRMKAVADHLPVGVWFADATGTIVYSNEAGRKIWGGARYVDPGEFHIYKAWWADTGKPLEPEDWAVARAVRKGETSLNEVLEIECFDGTRKTILNSAVPLKAPDGSFLGVVVLNEDITERMAAEQSLRRSEARYRSYIEVTGQLGWSTNADGEVVDDLPSLQQYTGQTLDEMKGWGWSKALHPDDMEITLAVWRKAVEEKQGYETEYRMRRHDGVYRHFLARGVPILNDYGSVREWVGTCIDITERRKQEEELRKLNRTLRALSRSNEALMRSEEESEFLEEVCRIVVQDCGYAMVWIGYAEDNEEKTVRPVAHAGFTEGYLESLNLTWADRERGRGPTGTAIRTGKPDRCINMLTDPRFEPWRDEALKRGYASSLALPLKDRSSTFGAITIYSAEPDPFSEEEIVLLTEMADDLTYGIASLRLRLQNRQALQALRESEARFRLLSDTAGHLLSADNPQNIIEQLCRDVMEHLDCHAFFNFMVDESAGRLRLNACAGIPEEEVRKLEWLDYGVAVCGCVARDEVRIIAEDIFHTPDERTELVRSYGIQAYCCHPLKARDRLIGTLSFGTKTRTRFTPEEVELMRTVADQVSVAMERMKVQRELRVSEEALRLANEQLEQRVRERTVELMLLMEDLEKSRDDLRRLASELVIAEERERKRISVILHDEVAQTLAATKMRLDLLRSMSGGDEYRRAISEAEELIGQSIRQTRALMTDITNPVLYDMGLKAAVEALAEDLKARQGIVFTCSFAGKLKNLGQEIEVMIFQVVKELAQNVVKHSRARNASIRIGEEENSVRVSVTDDGAGFDAGSVGMAGAEGGFGLFSIRERVKSYGGRIVIDSGPGKGARVDVMLPKMTTYVKAPGKAGRMAKNGPLERP